MKKIYLLVIVGVFANSLFSHDRLLTYKWPKYDKTGSLDKNFCKKLKQFFDIDIFIETGTYSGETTRVGQGIFKEVYSIELSKELYSEAENNFNNFSNVFLYLGSSDEILYKILPEIKEKERVLFYLDAHYSGGVTACNGNINNGAASNPILKELRAIKNCGIKNAIILIDDLRGFYAPPQNAPTLKEIKKTIKEVNSNYKFYAYGDIGIAFLPEDNVEVSNLIKEMTQWLFLEDKLEQKNKVFNLIDKAIDKEKESLVVLCEKFRNYIWGKIKK